MTIVLPLRQSRAVCMDMLRKDAKTPLKPGALVELVIPPKARWLQFRSDSDLWYQDRGNARSRTDTRQAIPYGAGEWHDMPISGVLEDQAVYLAATEQGQMLYLRCGGK